MCIVRICYMYRLYTVHIVHIVHIVNNIIYRAAGPMRRMGFTVEESLVAALYTVHIV